MSLKTKRSGSGSSGGEECCKLAFLVRAGVSVSHNAAVCVNVHYTSLDFGAPYGMAPTASFDEIAVGAFNRCGPPIKCASDGGTGSPCALESTPCRASHMVKERCHHCNTA